VSATRLLCDRCLAPRAYCACVPATPPVTPERDAVTRAREALRAAWYAWFDDKARISELRKAEDAYAAAVRQQALADAVRVVAAVLPPPTSTSITEAHRTMGVGDALQAIRTLAQETPDGR